MIDIFLEQPRISNQRLNAYGKEVGVLIGIKKTIILLSNDDPRLTKQNKQVGERIKCFYKMYTQCIFFCDKFFSIKVFL